jgi:hypothetical protein
MMLRSLADFMKEESDFVGEEEVEPGLSARLLYIVQLHGYP